MNEENEMVEFKTKCEMYERIIKMQENEIERLYTLLQQKHNQTKLPRSEEEITKSVIQVLRSNISKIDNSFIITCLSNQYPAYTSIIDIFSKIFYGEHTENCKLFNISKNSNISYMDEFDAKQNEHYTQFFDRLFPEVYEKCKLACDPVHINLHSELDNSVSDNCHSNILLLTRTTGKRAILQKELLKYLRCVSCK